MAKLTTKKRNALPKADFAVAGRKYPMNDRNHARNALARVAQHGTPKEKAEVRAKVHQKFPGIGRPTSKRHTEHAGKDGKREAKGHDAIGSHSGYSMMTKKR